MRARVKFDAPDAEEGWGARGGKMPSYETRSCVYIGISILEVKSSDLGTRHEGQLERLGPGVLDFSAQRGLCKLSRIFRGSIEKKGHFEMSLLEDVHVKI